MSTRATTERTARRSGPAYGQATAGAPDNRHTVGPVLAGDASRTAVHLPAGPTVHSRRRRASGTAPGRRLLGALTGAFFLLSAGGAVSDATVGGTLSAPAVEAGTAAVNSVSAHGDAEDLGPSAGLALASPLLGVTATSTGEGYWLVAGDGGVFAYGDADFHGSTGDLPLVAPVVGMAATASGGGYWLAASDGGVFAFGDAAYLGSTGDLTLSAPIVAITPTPTGDGYWLAASDGGVFAFGDATYIDAPQPASLPVPIVAMASTASGDGYWLLARDGGVFAFGDADFSGSAAGITTGAVGIAPDADGEGYWIAAADGAVYSFAADDLLGAAAAPSDSAPPVVGIAARPGGYWIARGETPPVVAPPSNRAHPFLVCTRSHESSHTPPLYDDGYAAVSSSGTYRGAYQFSRSTWNSTAAHAGRPDLVGVDPAAASPDDQDALALDLYHWQGASPWLGRCSGL